MKRYLVALLFLVVIGCAKSVKNSELEHTSPRFNCGKVKKPYVWEKFCYQYAGEALYKITEYVEVYDSDTGKRKLIPEDGKLAGNLAQGFKSEIVGEDSIQ